MLPSIGLGICSYSCCHCSQRHSWFPLFNETESWWYYLHHRVVVKVKQTTLEVPSIEQALYEWSSLLLLTTVITSANSCWLHCVRAQKKNIRASPTSDWVDPLPIPLARPTLRVLQVKPGALLECISSHPWTYYRLVRQWVGETKNRTDYSSIKAFTPVGVKSKSLMFL